MRKNPLKGLVIRTAVVVRPDAGFIYACNPKKEEKGIPHTVISKWHAGTFTQGDSNYSAHSVCVVQKPEYALVDISEPGYYSVESRSGVTSGDIRDNSQPRPKKARRGGFRSVSEIAGTAYAVGYQGMAYRLDKFDTWTRIDEGLPGSFDIDAIHGFDAKDIYAVGSGGEVRHFNGRKWTQRDVPTNANLNAVKCAGNGRVYIGGMGGILIQGTGDTWTAVDHEATEDDIWDLEWFADTLYVSTLEGVYRLNQQVLEEVDFGDDPPESTYQLSSAEGVMWSNGESDVMAFDGANWTRIV